MTDDPLLDWLPAGFAPHRIPTNGTTLFAAVGGEGPPLVLLHGWPQTSRAWRRVMPALAERFTVVVPDLRGTGRSDRPEDGYAKVDQARDVRGLLDGVGLGLAGPATVVGHDIGAMVALAWAADRPDDIGALVLLDALLPGFGLEESMDVARGGMWHFGFFMAPGVPEMLFDGHEREFVTATFTAMSTPGTFTEDDLAYYAASYTGRDRLRGGFAHYRTLLDDGRDNRRLLARRPLPMPVLAVGAGAAPSLDGVAEHLTALAAPTGHFIAEEDPDWLVRTLAAFIDPAVTRELIMTLTQTPTRRLTGHTAVVTGAAQGLGRAFARRLAAEGAAVAALDLEDPAETVEELTALGAEAAGFAVDVSDPAALAALVDPITDRVGVPDIVVNNAGTYPFMKLAEITPEAWRHVFAVNLDAQLFTTQAFMGGMIERGWGRIVNISSNSVGLQIPDAVHYVTSKMGVIGLTRGLATELAPHGITVNAVAPTATRTPGMSFAPDDLMQAVADQQTIKRIGMPEDLTGTVAFLASDDAAFVTAQTFFVDGGLVRT